MFLRTLIIIIITIIIIIIIIIINIIKMSEWEKPTETYEFLVHVRERIFC